MTAVRLLVSEPDHKRACLSRLVLSEALFKSV